MAWIECAAKCGQSFHDDERDGDDTCSEACRLHMLGAGPLELRRDDGGWRHYLLGEPVACGTGLELSPARPDEPDPDDYRYDGRGLRLERARVAALRDMAPLPVRYESPLATSGGPPPALLYTVVAGWTGVITAHDGMELRWPKKRSR